MWSRDYPMAKDGYANSLQIREIASDNGVLRQFPPKPILDAFKKETRFAPFALAGESKSFEVAQSDNSAYRVIAIKLKGKGDFQIEVDGYLLSYSASSSELTFDRSRSAYLEEKDGLRRTVYLGEQGLSDLLLLIDGYCYDFYLNGGLLSFSSQYYPTHRSLCFQGEVEVGSKVRMAGQEMVGVVQSLKGKRAQVAFGQILTTVDKSQLAVVSNSEYREATRPVTARTVVSADISSRKLNFKDHIDVRGMRVAEALEAVQDLIDDALMVGVGTVTILHGKGTGALKEEIRRYLRTVPEVVSAVDEHADRGGAGITIVTLS